MPVIGADDQWRGRPDLPARGCREARREAETAEGHHHHAYGRAECQSFLRKGHGRDDRACEGICAAPDGRGRPLSRALRLCARDRTPRKVAPRAIPRDADESTRAYSIGSALHVMTSCFAVRPLPVGAGGPCACASLMPGRRLSASVTPVVVIRLSDTASGCFGG